MATGSHRKRGTRVFDFNLLNSFIARKSSKKMKIAIALFIILTLLRIIQLYHTPNKSFEISAKETRAKNIKTILFWNSFFGAERFGLLKGNATFVNTRCKFANCAVWERDDPDADLPTDEYDAIVFHGLRSNLIWGEKVPRTRKPHQRYIFMLQESPATFCKVYDEPDFFNWTFTYRIDSDINACYGQVRDKSDVKLKRYYDSSWKTPSFEDINIPNFVKNRTKIVAWMSSRFMSDSQREKYVSRLQKYIPVDVYGRYGEFKCVGESICNDMLQNNYKFYLSFENSLCDDYVTEKFFRALKLYIVPIVYGGAIYKDIAPPMSYIDVQDFVSPEDLAKYVVYLHENPKEYEKYFWWRKWYTPEPVEGDDVWCRLCERLNDNVPIRKSYPDLKSWWLSYKVCHSPRSHFTTLQ